MIAQVLMHNTQYLLYFLAYNTHRLEIQPKPTQSCKAFPCLPVPQLTAELTTISLAVACIELNKTGLVFWTQKAISVYLSKPPG